MVLYNFCYDVPVKLFATNLILSCIFLALPDALSLCRYFWSHQPTAPTAAWVPPINRRAGRIAILVIEIIFAGAFIDPKGLPVTDFYVAPSSRAYTRSADGELWLSGVDLNTTEHTVRISCYFINPPTNYTWQLSDPNHLVLTSVPPKPSKSAPPFKSAVLTLTRTPTPDHYPLLERGFHFISEWRYER